MKKKCFSICLVFVLIIVASALTAYAEEGFWTKFSSPDDIIGYRSFSSYNQAPQLKELVDSGKLPPVEERLPKEPMVWKKNMMQDGIGEYGGIWRDTFSASVQGWNWGAGQSHGWFGISQIVHEGLIEPGPMWMLETPQITPNLARSWEWSEDGKTLTMHLVEGVKWSDGVEFTTDDVIFSYRDNIVNERVQSFSSKGSWTYGGEVTELEKIDDYTLKWHFGKAFPIRALFKLDYVSFPLSPAHVYQKYHPKYNEDMTYDEYTTVTPPQSLPAVVLGSHVPVAFEPGQQQVFVRNPFYWKVDEEGNQLPYLDEVWFMYAQEAEKGLLNLIAGSTDRGQVNLQQLSMGLQAEQEPDSHFNLHWPPVFNFGNPALAFNLSLEAGVNSEEERELRKLFRKKEFRQAVSHAIDREGIAEALLPGPYVGPWYGGLPSGSPMYDESKVVKYEYDLDKAKELLAGLGFEDTDDDGIVNWPENTPEAGKNLTIECLIDAGQTLRVEVSEMLAPQLRKAGIDLRVKPLKGSALGPKLDSGDFDSHLIKCPERLTPFLYPEFVGPVTKNSPMWHISDPEEGRELLPFEEEIQKLLEETETMVSSDERKQVFGEIQRLMTENIYTVGITQGKYANGITKRARNVPADIPGRMYGWFYSGTPIHAFGFVPKHLQLETQYQHLIPTPDVYEGQEWW